MSTEIKVFTFGKLLIQRNGEILEDFITTKAVLLFVYLAMYPGEHTRKKLASMFWSETTDKQALKNLRTVLSSLRQQLDEYLIVSQDVLAINDEMPVTVDAVEFEEACIRLLSSHGTLDLLKSMQDLIQLYTGPFLDGVTIRDAAFLDQWVLDKQDNLHQLYMRLLFEMSAVAEKQSQYESALSYARQLVNLDPLWDASQRQLMRLLAYTDRTNEALMQYERFTRLLETELQAAPEDETVELMEKIRSRSLRQVPPIRKPAIVLPDMPFIEPTEDVEIAQRMLSTSQCHLLTIFGISGIGKTALVTQLAYHRQHLYRDGAYIISLKRAQSSRDLPFLIAGTLSIEIPNHSDRWILENIVIENLKQREILLVLDNYEHIMPETDFVQRILEETTTVKLVITAQSPLNIFREWLVPLKGLSIPLENDGHAEQSESVRLFALAAQRINPRFNLQDNLAGVVKICQLVDGLPLALVIAAGWTQVISIPKIIEFIVDGQEFSLPAQQTLPPRHQSLEMMLDYTWNTLTPEEQDALTALSIFNSVFNLDEVNEVCGINIEILAKLIQKSLVQKFDENYRMHQFIWRYARKKLLYSDQKRALGLRHMVYYTHVLSMLQTESPSLHEYIMSIEMRYSSIWNYDWLPRSFQPLYLLAVARYLITYWEVSRTDSIQEIRSLFESFSHENLQSDTRTLLHLILARLYAQDNYYEEAYQHLHVTFNTNVVDLKWSDRAIIYQLYAPIFYLRSNTFQPDQHVYQEEEGTIMHRAHLKLASLFLDMRDYAAAEGLYTHLMSIAKNPMEHALIHAVRGSISAEEQNYDLALNYFRDALAHLGEDEPLLKLSLISALVRLMHHLQRQEEFQHQFIEALNLAADITAVDAMRHLLQFYQTQLANGRQETVSSPPSQTSISGTLENALQKLESQPIRHSALISIVQEIANTF